MSGTKPCPPDDSGRCQSQRIRRRSRRPNGERQGRDKCNAAPIPPNKCRTHGYRHNHQVSLPCRPIAARGLESAPSRPAWRSRQRGLLSTPVALNSPIRAVTRAAHDLTTRLFSRADSRQSRETLLSSGALDDFAVHRHAVARPQHDHVATHTSDVGTSFFVVRSTRALAAPD